MKVEASDFGVVSGDNATLYTLSNSQGMQVKILNYGGIIHELNVPDNQGKLHACVQSYTTIDGYVGDPSYRNAIVGRFANRIGYGRFTLEGTEYHLDKNGGSITCTAVFQVSTKRCGKLRQKRMQTVFRYL